MERNNKGQFKKGHKGCGASGKRHWDYKHGMSGTRPYKIWCGMKRRCYNKNEINYARYGGKGVRVSKEGLNFINFWKDMKDGYADDLQIDRIDNSKGYSLENCRWVTVKEQQRNKSNVTLYKHNGKELTSFEWDKELGLARGTVRARIKYYKWSLERALTTPKITKYEDQCHK